MTSRADLWKAMHLTPDAALPLIAAALDDMEEHYAHLEEKADGTQKLVIAVLASVTAASLLLAANAALAYVKPEASPANAVALGIGFILRLFG